jgi:D-psicose/D-tagatose/L-ribulose 3-epimerase
MIRFGVSTWVWVSPATNENLRWLVPHVASLGFDWIEFPIEEPGALDYRAIGQITRDHGLGVSICGAFSPDRDLIHPDPALQQNGLAFLKECIDAAYQVGARRVGGPFYSSVGRTWQQTPGEREHDMEVLVRHLTDMARYADDHGVTICLEALNRFESSFINLTSQAVELAERVNHPAVQVMVDTFHMNIEEQNVGAAIRFAGPRLQHIHSNESHRGTPGTGLFPWQDLALALKEIHYDGALVIETFTVECKSIARAAAIWRPLASSQDDLARDGMNFLKGLFA